MIKKAVIFYLISFTLAIIENPLKTSYDGRLYYPSKPEEFHHHNENHWAELYFFYDSQCSLSTNKKTALEKYFRMNRSMGGTSYILSPLGCFNLKSILKKLIL
jgi:hypothetical protein